MYFSPQQLPLVRAAEQCFRLGYVVIPISTQKRPVVKWKDYQTSAPGADSYLKGFNYSFTEGIALLCGKVSGGLQVIDIDSKNDLTKTMAQEYLHMLQQNDPTLFDKLTIARTPSGGMHLFFKCDEINPSEPLALRPPTSEELAKNPDLGNIILIETRADNGMACIAPTKGYTFIQGNISSIPTLSAAERAYIIQSAKSFNQVIPQVEEKKESKHSFILLSSNPSDSPIDDFNARGDVIGLLEKHGWIIVESNSEKTIFLRPGETDKYSSANFNHEKQLFSTFSTSTKFEARKGYSPAKLFIQLEANGDKTEGIKKLLQLGFGKSYKEQARDAKQQLKNRPSLKK